MSNPHLEKQIKEVQEKFDKMFNSYSDEHALDHMKRLHCKFFACMLFVEKEFKKRFPNEWIEYEHEFYGDDK